MTLFYSRTNVYICVYYMYPIICIKGEFYKSHFKKKTSKTKEKIKPESRLKKQFKNPDQSQILKMPKYVLHLVKWNLNYFPRAMLRNLSQ